MTHKKQQVQRTCLKPAFSLIETLISVVLVGGLLVAALNTVGSAALGRGQMTNAARGMLLAQQLVAEILRQPYDEPIDTPVFGREATESVGDRALYDDVDDYYDWSASPPEYNDGTALANLTGWTRSVDVVWGDPTDPTKSISYDAGIKRITVTILRGDKLVASITTTRTRSGDAIVGESGAPIGN